MSAVYAVYKNSDMTEGRGPMVLDSLWWSEEDAWAYANKHLGVMGTKPFREHQGTCPTCGTKRETEECRGWACKICHKYGGDWQVKEMEVHAS